MKKLRNKGDDLAEMLKNLKIGDEPIFDAVTNYEIVKVPGGYIYKNEYAGMVFVPDVTGQIKNSIAKTEPKRMVTK